MVTSPLQPVEPRQLAKALKNILPEMFKSIGLTMIDSKIEDSGYFSFRIKEFNKKLLFDYDGSYIELVVYHRHQFIDYLMVIAVPLVSAQNNNYYAHWSGKARFMGPFSSIEKLMKHYLPRQLRSWIKKMLPETSIHIYRSSSKGFTMAKLVNSSNPPFPEDQEYLSGEMVFWEKAL